MWPTSSISGSIHSDRERERESGNACVIAWKGYINFYQCHSDQSEISIAWIWYLCKICSHSLSHSLSVWEEPKNITKPVKNCPELNMRQPQNLTFVSTWQSCRHSGSGSCDLITWRLYLHLSVTGTLFGFSNLHNRRLWSKSS